MLKKPNPPADADVPFGAVPLRARSDPRLTALDLRVLVEIAYRDRMSEINGGAGCWARHETLCANIGCHYTNLSKSIRRLIKFGYLQRREQASDRRRHTLTVIYNSGPDNRQLQEKVVGQVDQLSNGLA